MPIVKLRKLTHSYALTVPKEFAIVADNYHVYQSEDGMLLYVPDNIKNPFGKSDLAYFKQKYGKK
ncbi:hypothetical protein [Lactobacillus equicursoris]|uniref:hypothetical protein n=1 Tax=Lactobacillus equicursoris TaxID=420645 RepID=UPI001E476C0B|nr:hypothetical protein [Lactobacillus equicursoris]